MVEMQAFVEAQGMSIKHHQLGGQANDAASFHPPLGCAVATRTEKREIELRNRSDGRLASKDLGTDNVRIAGTGINVGQRVLGFVVSQPCPDLQPEPLQRRVLEILGRKRHAACAGIAGMQSFEAAEVQPLEADFLHGDRRFLAMERGAIRVHKRQPETSGIIGGRQRPDGAADIPPAGGNCGPNEGSEWTGVHRPVKGRCK